MSQVWPQFRGPDGQGRAQVNRLPLQWAEASSNLAWKAPIQGLGWSSPVAANGTVWLTTATNEGRSLRALSLDASTGRGLVDVEVFQLAAPGRVHQKNSHASPTPVIQGDRVWVHFGAYGTGCLSTRGEVIWRAKLKYEHVHGPGGSPAAAGNLLLIGCDGSDEQFVVALDRATGAVRWKVPRPSGTHAKKFAFSTPLVIEAGGRRQAVSPGAGSVVSYDPETGRELWRVGYGEGYSVVPRPAYGQGLVFLSTGFDRPTLLAIRPDGSGDVTATHVEWRMAENAPHSPSPLLVGEELYVVSDAGVATCLEARTGRVHWRERLGGNFSASPFFGAERIYFLDERGVATVVQPGKKFVKLARNEVRGRTLASPAPVEGALFLRTDSHLLRIDAEKER